MGLQEVLRQQFLQVAPGQHSAPAHFQLADDQPQPILEGQGPGQSEGNPGAAFSYQKATEDLPVC